MKIGLAISAVILLVLGLAVFFKLQPAPADAPTSASSDANLALQSLPKDLPTFGVSISGDAGDASELFETATDANRWVRGGFEPETKIEESQEVARLLKEAARTPMQQGFLDRRTPTNRFESPQVKRGIETLATTVSLHVKFHIEEAEFDPARQLAAAQLAFGRQMFENNIRLKPRQQGLLMMSSALNAITRIAMAAEQDGAITPDQLAAINADVAKCFEAVNQVNKSWNAKLRSVESVAPDKGIPNIGDLIRIAEQDKDRTFRVFGALRLGFAQFERTDPGNQSAIASALERAKASDDAMVHAAAEAGLNITDKEQYHELR